MIEMIGGPDRDRTGDLFHAMEARSQLRHRPTLRKDSLYSPASRAECQTPVGGSACDVGGSAVEWRAVISLPSIRGEMGTNSTAAGV